MMTEEYIFNPTTKKEHGIGEVEIHIEQQILKILEAGAGSGDPGEIRPLREIIQTFLCLFCKLRRYALNNFSQIIKSQQNFLQPLANV